MAAGNWTLDTGRGDQDLRQNGYNFVVAVNVAATAHPIAAVAVRSYHDVLLCGVACLERSSLEA